VWPHSLDKHAARCLSRDVPCATLAQPSLARTLGTFCSWPGRASQAHTALQLPVRRRPRRRSAPPVTIRAAATLADAVPPPLTIHAAAALADAVPPPLTIHAAATLADASPSPVTFRAAATLADAAPLL